MDGQRSMNLVVAQVLLAGTALGACEADLPLRRRLLKGLFEDSESAENMTVSHFSKEFKRIVSSGSPAYRYYLNLSSHTKFDLTRAHVEEILGYAPAMSLSPSDYFMQGLELGLWRLLLTSQQQPPQTGATPRHPGPARLSVLKTAFCSHPRFESGTPRETVSSMATSARLAQIDTADLRTRSFLATASRSTAPATP